MDNKYKNLIDQLNNDDINIRLDSLKELVNGIEKGDIEKPVSKSYVNNHIHTTYSFSPYTPTMAIWMAYNAGLTTAGIMDHDSIGGAREFIRAGDITGMATTIGVECRADFSKTPLNGRRINNPDQKSIAYMALHGIPHTKIDTVKDFFARYLKERNRRNQLMVNKINEIFFQYNIRLDFEKDVLSISQSYEGGSVTERHLLYALADKFIVAYGKGTSLLDFLINSLKLNINSKLFEYLLDTNNDYYRYDLLGLLKSQLISSFYIDASSECPDVRDVIDLSKSIGSISAYAYLGDIGDSVTGDKKSQTFEDHYLDLLFKVIKDLGFNAVTYMPSRNTMEQMLRIKSLCEENFLFQISGEDINSPRQSFVCEALKNDEFSNLIDSTWALIGHEKAATINIDEGMFSGYTVDNHPDINERIAIYKVIGKRAP